VAESPDFYVEAGSKLSQGDIVADVPWGIVPDPISVCRPNDPKNSEGKAFYAPHHQTRRGGDAFHNGRVELVHARAKLGRVMVLWHDCEIDKFEEKGMSADKWFAGVAPIIPPDHFPSEVWDKIATGDRLQFFPLPPIASVGLPAGSCVDLRYVWPVRQSLLSKRLASLGTPARLALYDHLFSFLTHRRLRDKVLCPSCHDVIGAEDLFEATADE